VLQRSTDHLPHSASNPALQRGSTLFEGLIAMLLVGIVGVGLTYVLSRSAISQTTVNAQNQVINQIRSQLTSSAGGVRNLCSTTTPAPISLASGVTAAVSVSCVTAAAGSSVTVTVGTSTQTAYVPRFTANIAADSAGALGGSLSMGTAQ
jgi:hypothetical protein